VTKLFELMHSIELSTYLTS